MRIYIILVAIFAIVGCSSTISLSQKPRITTMNYAIAKQHPIGMAHWIYPIKAGHPISSSDVQKAILGTIPAGTTFHFIEIAKSGNSPDSILSLKIDDGDWMGEEFNIMCRHLDFLKINDERNILRCLERKH